MTVQDAILRRPHHQNTHCFLNGRTLDLRFASLRRKLRQSCEKRQQCLMSDMADSGSQIRKNCQIHSSICQMNVL